MQNLSTFHRELTILCHCLLLILHCSDAFWCFSDALPFKMIPGPGLFPQTLARAPPWIPLGLHPQTPTGRPSACCTSRTLHAQLAHLHLHWIYQHLPWQFSQNPRLHPGSWHWVHGRWLKSGTNWHLQAFYRSESHGKRFLMPKKHRNRHQSWLSKYMPIF